MYVYTFYGLPYKGSTIIHLEFEEIKLKMGG